MSQVSVDHLNTFLGGGAAIAARRVHDGLRQAGAISRFWYQIGIEPPDESYQRWQPPPATSGLERLVTPWQVWRARKRLKRALKGRPTGLEPFHPASSPAKRFDGQAFRGDILHLHWIGGAFDYSFFFAMHNAAKPIVWTLHDMNAVTGGCHYSNGCMRFETGCGACPQLAGRGERDLSSETFAIKLRATPVSQMHIVAPSRWLLQLAQSSPILRNSASFHLVPYGLDLKTFRPRNQFEARERLGLPAEGKVLAFGADEVDNQRKGVDALCEMLRRLGDLPDLTCVVFGRGELPLSGSQIPVVRNFGFVESMDRLADLYSAADIFVMPSLEDNLPQTGIESLACGAPVAAFAVGGTTDYVLPGKTGVLAEVGDATSLAESIREYLTKPAGERRKGRDQSRQLAEQMFAPKKQANRYLQIYDDALASRR